MRTAKILLPLLLVAIGAGIAEGQFTKSFRPIQRIDRWLSVGNGPGYHWQNPGIDSSYYNPWSANNTSLVSQGSSAAGNVYGFGADNPYLFAPPGAKPPAPGQQELRFGPSTAPREPDRSGESKGNGTSGASARSFPIPAARQSTQWELELPPVANRQVTEIWANQPPLPGPGS